MLKTYLYIPEQLGEEINFLAKMQKKSKAKVMRDVLQEGINTFKKRQYAGAEALLELAKTAKKYKIKGPRDGSVNHDYYLWGLPKKNPRIKP